MENLHDHRKSYEKDDLQENNLQHDPFEQFKLWFSEAEVHPEIVEANAMAISTVEEDGCPRIRTVLLKSYSEEGFVFYTNYDSRKGIALEKRPLASLHFFWPALERQVILKAKVQRVKEKISDTYFAERPRGSQLGALVSPQSKKIESRETLEKNLKQLEDQYIGKEIVRPKNWGGYLAVPYEIEFWQGRPNRLHDRILYELQENNNWDICRLAP